MQEEIQKYRKKEQKTNAYFSYIATRHILTGTRHSNIVYPLPLYYCKGYTLCF